MRLTELAEPSGFGLNARGLLLRLQQTDSPEQIGVTLLLSLLFVLAAARLTQHYLLAPHRARALLCLAELAGPVGLGLNARKLLLRLQQTDSPEQIDVTPLLSLVFALATAN